MMKKFGDLNSKPAQQKDHLAPLVRIGGWTARSRVLMAQFPAATDSALVRLNVSLLDRHQFKVVAVEGKPNEGVETKTHHDLVCESMERRGECYAIARFEDQERAEQALQAIVGAFHSKKKWVVAGVVVAAVWMLLFMPLPQGGNNNASAARAPSINPAALGMQQRMQQQGLQMPSATPSQLAMPSAVSPLPSAVTGMAQVTGAAPMPATPAAPISAVSAEDDPFGLKIGPSGGSVPGPLQQR